MNILVIGSGGREHALAWKINQSPKCEKLFVAPGNAGTASFAENVAIGGNEFDALGDFVKKEQVELVVVGPEEPLVKGIRDYFEKDEVLRKVAMVGPGEAGARLEGSKDFSKEFMTRHNIPTAKARTFKSSELAEAEAYVESMNLPVVLKADGLAAGKGVIIAETYEEAKKALHEMLVESKFGAASAKVLVEEFLKGIELSVFVLTDGQNYKVLPEAKDYKRIGEGDTGLNTGGMGAVSPVSFAQGDFLDKVEEKVIKPTVKGLKEDGIPYVGFLFIGLMNVNGEPYVIEYNVRMGDPETEVVIPRIQSDFASLLYAAGTGKLDEETLEIDDQTAVTVVLVSGGYPEAYEKGKSISGLDKVKEVTPFHAGTKSQDRKILTNGGRVIAVTAKGEKLQMALDKAYQAAGQIDWEGMNYRKDIGQDLLKLEQ